MSGLLSSDAVMIGKMRAVLTLFLILFAQFALSATEKTQICGSCFEGRVRLCKHKFLSLQSRGVAVLLEGGNCMFVLEHCAIGYCAYDTLHSGTNETESGETNTQCRKEKGRLLSKCCSFMLPFFSRSFAFFSVRLLSFYRWCTFC